MVRRCCLLQRCVLLEYGHSDLPHLRVHALHRAQLLPLRRAPHYRVDLRNLAVLASHRLQYALRLRVLGEEVWSTLLLLSVDAAQVSACKLVNPLVELPLDFQHQAAGLVLPVCDRCSPLDVVSDGVEGQLLDLAELLLELLYSIDVFILRYLRVLRAVFQRVLLL